MNKKYYITIEQSRVSFGDTFKVELEDHHGNYTCVYERSIEEAMTYAQNWCKQAEQREKERQIHAKAVAEMIKIDREAGITTSMSDGLD